VLALIRSPHAKGQGVAGYLGAGFLSVQYSGPHPAAAGVDGPYICRYMRVTTGRAAAARVTQGKAAAGRIGGQS
jgi:hypothetical protein